MIPNKGPKSGGTHIKVIGLNMYPLESVKNIDISKWSFFKFGHVLTKVGLYHRQQATAISPSSLFTGKVLVQVSKIFFIFFFFF